MKNILLQYESESFSLLPSGMPKYTICHYVMKVIRPLGVPAKDNTIRQVGEFTLYPVDFFNPIDDHTGVIHKTANTRSIHWFRKSWMPNQTPLRIFASRMAHRFLGYGLSARIRKVLKIK